MAVAGAFTNLNVNFVLHDCACGDHVKKMCHTLDRWHRSQANRQVRTAIVASCLSLIVSILTWMYTVRWMCCSQCTEVYRGRTARISSSLQGKLQG